MRYLGPDDLRAALPMTAAIEAMREAFGDDRETPPRALVGPSLFMPGRVGDVSGIKVVSTEPGNPVGIVAVFDARGTPLGLCHGPTLTALRTGAASGLATDLMARPDSRAMAMLGAGAMALDQVEAVRTIDRVLVWSRNMDHAEALAERAGGSTVTDPGEAVGPADIISTATPATSPPFPAGAARRGTHVNAIGTFAPAMRELPAALLRESFVVVDDHKAAAAEAGDLLQAGVEPDATMALWPTFSEAASRHPRRRRPYSNRSGSRARMLPQPRPLIGRLRF